MARALVFKFTSMNTTLKHGELHSFTGLESPAIQGTFRGGKLCVRGCAIPHGGALVESGESVARFMESKQKVTPELEDEKCLSDLALT